MSGVTDTQADYRNVDDVFESLSINEIKSLEIDLRSQAASKKTELRLLVGESYRDLLTTADTIVSMRDSSVLVRQQLKTLSAACNGVAVSKKLQNLAKFPSLESEVKAKVLSQYLKDSRGLIVHFIRNGDLVTAARLYTLARLISSTMQKDNLSLSKGIKQLRRIVINAINQCTDVREFASSFAILESTTPQASLKYYLSLQLSNLRSCKTLLAFTQAILKLFDVSREFSHLGDAFEQLSKKTLISSLIHLPEMDGKLLLTCLSEDLRHFRPFLRTDLLSNTSIRELVDQWLNFSVQDLQEIIGNIFADTKDLAVTFREIRQVQNLLHEVSHEPFFETFSGPLDKHVTGVLAETLEALEAMKSLSRKIRTSSEDPPSLWSSKLPWIKGTLENFRSVTSMVSRGFTKSFASFEHEYLASAQVIKKNLEILEQSQSHVDRRNAYRESVLQSMQVLQETLLLDLPDTGETLQIVQTLRLLLYISKWSPVVLPIPSKATEYFRKLIPQVAYECTTRNYSPIFDNSLPISISPELAQYLFSFTTSVTDLGIDIIGCTERTEIRNAISLALEQAIHRMHNRRKNGMLPDLPPDSLTSSITNGLHTLMADVETKEGLPDHKTSAQEVHSSEAKPSSYTETTEMSTSSVISPEAAEPISPTPVNGLVSQNNADIVEEPNSASTTNGTGSTETQIGLAAPSAVADENVISEANEGPESLESNKSGASSPAEDQEKSPSSALDLVAIDLQNYFDVCFVELLLSLSGLPRVMEHHHLTNEQQEKIAENVKIAVGRAKVQYRVLLP